MPTSESFTSLYDLGGTLPDGTTTYPASSPQSFNLTDDPDGDPNGVTAVGDELYFNFTFSELVGFTSINDPIIRIGGGNYYVCSNNSSLTGNIGFTTGGQNLGNYLYCFSPETKILTPDGEMAVKDLSIGDWVLTTSGTAVVVKWLGLQTTSKLLGGLHLQPVRFMAGALGDGLPHSDLTVTADHGMILDGLVINASALVNGTTIDWVPVEELPDRVTYYHIETGAHDIILANGAPTETFIDIPGRKAFDNYQEYLDLYGAERIIPEMRQPRISSRRLLPDAIKARLGIVDEVIDLDLGLTA